MSLPLSTAERERLRQAIQDNTAAANIFAAINNNSAGGIAGVVVVSSKLLDGKQGAVLLDTSPGASVIVMPPIGTKFRRIFLRHTSGPYVVKVAAVLGDEGVGEVKGGIVYLRPREAVALLSDTVNKVWRVVARIQP